MSKEKLRGELLAAFEAHKSRIAAAMIGGGEGARVRQVLERVSLSDFESGWKSSREALVIELPDAYAWDNDGGFEKEYDPESECSMSLIPKIDVVIAIEAAGVKVKP